MFRTSDYTSVVQNHLGTFPSTVTVPPAHRRSHPFKTRIPELQPVLSTQTCGQTAENAKMPIDAELPW